MLPLWHTHVFGTSVYLLQHTLLSIYSAHIAALVPLTLLSLSVGLSLCLPHLWIPRSLVHWSPKSMSASQLNDWKFQIVFRSTISNVVYEYHCRLRDVAAWCFQSACFLPLSTTTSYLPLQVSAILGCMQCSFSIHMSLPRIPFSIAKQKGRKSFFFFFFRCTHCSPVFLVWTFKDSLLWKQNRFPFFQCLLL